MADTEQSWDFTGLTERGWATDERAGGIPAYGNSRSAWDKGERFGFVQPT